MNCGCRTMVDVIRLNERDQPTWNCLLKTFANVCGRCAHKQMKFPTDGKYDHGKEWICF